MWHNLGQDNLICLQLQEKKSAIAKHRCVAMYINTRVSPAYTECYGETQKSSFTNTTTSKVYT